MSKGGVFVPGTVEDRFERDSAFGRIVAMGDRPDYFHGKGRDFVRKEDVRYFEHSGTPWPEDYPDVKVDDLVLFPRDVELVLLHEGKRFGIVNLHEIIATGPGLAESRMVMRDKYDPEAAADPKQKSRVDLLVEGDDVEAGNLIGAYKE
jgi:hypothetical protein